MHLSLRTATGVHSATACGRSLPSYVPYEKNARPDFWVHVTCKECRERFRMLWPSLVDFHKQREESFGELFVWREMQHKKSVGIS